MTEILEKTIDIVDVGYLSEYHLNIHFSDGHNQVVDFGPFLKKSHHPEIRKYLEFANFMQFSVVDGNLDWNDFELCFPTADLYNNTILHT